MDWTGSVICMDWSQNGQKTRVLGMEVVATQYASDGMG
jgi:hypothetical protein